MSGSVRARTVLASVVALQLIAETALTPYWPTMFRTMFGVDELAATGTFLTVCRVAGLAAMPLWGLAALRWPLRRLLVAGLLASTVFDLALALAPGVASFTVFSAAVVASGSSLVLAYPALVSVVEEHGRGDRLSAVVLFSAVFHASAVVATLVGAGIAALPEPRWGLAAFSAVDLVLAVLVARCVPNPSSVAEKRRTAPGNAEAHGGHDARPARNATVGLVAVVVAVAVLVDSGLAVPRPFFVELVVRDGVSLGVAGLLFLLPAAAALAVLPVIRPLNLRLRRALLPVAAGVGAFGLLLQAVATIPSDGLGVLVAGRVLLGVGLGLLLVALDLAIFAAVGTAGPGFSTVETGRSAALLAAPVIATAAATTSLAAPLVAGAALLLCAAACSLRLPTSPQPRHQEVPDALAAR